MKYTDGYTDVGKLFRRCFLCRGRKHLSRVVHPGYSTTFDYYHGICLEKVMASPEEYPQNIDSAIQIMDQLHSDELKKQEARRNLQVQVQRLKNITGKEQKNSAPKVEIPPQSMKSRYLILKEAQEKKDL